MSMSTMKPFQWANAASVEQALALVGEKGTALKAGGVDLVDLMKEQIASPERVVNIRAIRELHYVNLADAASGGLRSGPIFTLTRLSEEPVVRQKFTALADAAGHAATP